MGNILGYPVFKGTKRGGEVKVHQLTINLYISSIFYPKGIWAVIGKMAKTVNINKKALGTFLLTF